MAAAGRNRPRSSREAALLILDRVEGGGAYADILLEEVLSELEARERGLATELVYGVLRMRSRLDWIIGAFSKIKTGRLETGVLNAIRLGVYQLCFLDGIPPSAAIDESVKLVKKGVNGKKRGGFVNAVLRSVETGKAGVAYPDAEKDPAGFISVFHSHPLWLVRRWIGRYGAQETEMLCKANLAPPPRVLRVNTLATGRDNLIEELKKQGVEATGTRFSPDGLVASRGGALSPGDARFYIQDEASQLVARLVAPKPGETILDACAAPGGKTTHMAAMMGDKGAIFAIDRSAARLKTVEAAARRLGIGIIRTKTADAGGDLNFEKGSFDAILLDAPCSGLGVVRRTPDIKWRIREEDLKELSQRQKRLLNNLAKYLKKGGRLVYSVCSLEPDETDDVIRDFLAGNPGFKVEGAADILPQSCKQMTEARGALRTFPHRDNTDGFFAVRLKATLKN